MGDIEVVELLIKRGNLIPVESSVLVDRGINIRKEGSLLRCFECKDLYLSPSYASEDYIYRVKYLMCTNNVRANFKLTHYNNWAICSTIGHSYDGLYLSRSENWLNELAEDLVICESISSGNLKL